MNAYIIGGYRSPVGKSGKGAFRFVRPDDLGEQVIRKLLGDFPQLDKERIDDVIVGNATPEAEQGLNIGRMVSLMGLDTEKVPGMTVNRYCASGLETIAIASAKIHAGLADCILAGGIESMSPFLLADGALFPMRASPKPIPIGIGEWGSQRKPSPKTLTSAARHKMPSHSTAICAQRPRLMRADLHPALPPLR